MLIADGGTGEREARHAEWEAEQRQNARDAEWESRQTDGLYSTFPRKYTPPEKPPWMHGKTDNDIRARAVIDGTARYIELSEQEARAYSPNGDTALYGHGKKWDGNPYSTFPQDYAPPRWAFSDQKKVQLKPAQKRKNSDSHWDKDTETSDRKGTDESNDADASSRVKLVPNSGARHAADARIKGNTNPDTKSSGSKDAEAVPRVSLLAELTTRSEAERKASAMSKNVFWEDIVKVPLTDETLKGAFNEVPQCSYFQECLKAIPTREIFIETIRFDKATGMHYPKSKPRESGGWTTQSIEDVHRISYNNNIHRFDIDDPKEGLASSVRTDCVGDLWWNAAYSSCKEDSAFRFPAGQVNTLEMYTAQSLMMGAGDNFILTNERPAPMWTQCEEVVRTFHNTLITCLPDICEKGLTTTFGAGCAEISKVYGCPVSMAYSGTTREDTEQYPAPTIPGQYTGDGKTKKSQLSRCTYTSSNNDGLPVRCTLVLVSRESTAVFKRGTQRGFINPEEDLYIHQIIIECGISLQVHISDSAVCHSYVRLNWPVDMWTILKSCEKLGDNSLSDLGLYQCTQLQGLENAPIVKFAQAFADELQLWCDHTGQKLLYEKNSEEESIKADSYEYTGDAKPLVYAHCEFKHFMLSERLTFDGVRAEFPTSYGRGTHYSDNSTDASLTVVFKMTHILPIKYLMEYHYKVRKAADLYDPLSGMDDFCMERNKMVCVGKFTQDAWEDGNGTDAQLRDSIFGDYETSGGYSQHHPVMFPIEKLDDNTAESMITRNNKRHSFLHPQAEPLLKTKGDLQSKYMKDRCLPLKLNHSEIPQGQPFFDDSVEGLETKFRFILGACTSKTTVTQMFVKSRLVFDTMKEIQNTRALAQTSLFPNIKRENLSAMQLFVLSENSQPHFEFQEGSAKKPAVCKPLNLSTSTPQSMAVSSGRKEADTVDTQIAGLPKRQVNNAPGSTVPSVRRGKKRALEIVNLGAEESRMKKVCKDLVARFSAGSKNLLSEDQVQEKLFPRREITAKDNGKAIVRITPESNRCKRPCFCKQGRYSGWSHVPKTSVLCQNLCN